MRLIRSLLIAAAVALVALSASSTALASRGIRFSNSTIAAGGRLTINGNGICDVLLTIVAANPFLKVTGVNQGTMAGTIRACSGLGSTGAGTVLSGITVRYAAFSGTLPSIRGITIQSPNFGIQLATIIGNCLYGGSLTGLTFPVSAGQVTGVDFNASSTLPRVSGAALCPATWTLRGALSTLGTPPTVTLV